MSEYSPSTASSTWGSGGGGGGGAGRERGARRKKVYEYLKAANELRQTYTAQWSAQRSGVRDYNEDYLNTPGAFPDVEIARSGDEEMVIFPSYARRLIPKKTVNGCSSRRRGSSSTIDEYRGISNEPEPGMPEWEEFEDDNAIVAVDVRGWVYAPNRGPMTRKHRLAIALARKMSGIPAPSSIQTDTEGPNQDDERLPKMTEKREEELVDSEAQSIIKKVEKGNESGWKADGGGDEDIAPSRTIQRTPTTTSIESVQLTKDELSVANAHLMERIRPFLTSPMVGMAVTVFFFSDNKSQSRNVLTNESGHFSLRASLPFVPTHIRVLASEDLSVVKSVDIIEPTGVSLISDIDDTVKHSAITSGAKEIFRNVFVRELADLTINGVTDWYTGLAKLGVEVHYVSNAPWQLYPLLERYFKLVGLPPGSFHLKQYSGMLQGIFEPAAERKRGSLEQILQDFPERKFILVGDSGEADLEVYTDIVLANPGRILGVFIRDITTPTRKQFFEKSVDHLESDPPRNRSTPELIDHSDSAVNRPALPPRPSRVPSEPSADSKGLESTDLIDLSDEVPPKPASISPGKPLSTRTPPTIPSKPSSLRSVTHTNDLVDKSSAVSETKGVVKRKPVPPLPRRRAAEPGSSPQPSDSIPENHSKDLSSTYSADMSTNSIVNQPPSRASPLRSPEVNTPAPRVSKQPPPPPPPRRSNTGSSTVNTSLSQLNMNRLTSQNQQAFPTPSTAPTSPSSPSGRPVWPPPPTSVLRAPASNPALRRTSTNSTDSLPPSRTASVNSTASQPTPLPNKREELWRRRWERASEILRDRGVVLGSWRTGKDVQDVTTWLVKEALEDMNGGKPTGQNEKEKRVS